LWHPILAGYSPQSLPPIISCTSEQRNFGNTNKNSLTSSVANRSLLFLLLCVPSPLASGCKRRKIFHFEIPLYYSTSEACILHVLMQTEKRGVAERLNFLIPYMARQFLFQNKESNSFEILRKNPSLVYQSNSIKKLSLFTFLKQYESS